jgi:hypothetical protein
MTWHIPIEPGIRWDKETPWVALPPLMSVEMRKSRRRGARSFTQNSIFSWHLECLCPSICHEHQRAVQEQNEKQKFVFQQGEEHLVWPTDERGGEQAQEVSKEGSGRERDKLWILLIFFLE